MPPNDGAMDQPSPEVDQAYRLGYEDGLRAAQQAIQGLGGAAAEESEPISMEEQRRIHSRALSQSGPPSSGESKAQRVFRLQCEASIERDRAAAERLGLTLTYDYPFD